MGVHLIGVHLVGVHPIGVHLISVHVMGYHSIVVNTSITVKGQKGRVRCVDRRYL